MIYLIFGYLATSGEFHFILLHSQKIYQINFAVGISPLCISIIAHHAE